MDSMDAIDLDNGYRGATAEIGLATARWWRKCLTVEPRRTDKRITAISICSSRVSWNMGGASKDSGKGRGGHRGEGGSGGKKKAWPRPGFSPIEAPTRACFREDISLYET
jgi:hypothetical protein